MPPCISFQRAIESSAIELSDDPDPGPYKRLFPKSKLAAICSSKTIQDVLSCCCWTCSEQSDGVDRNFSILEAADCITGQEGGSSLILTFSLLAYIGCPRLISYCLQKKPIVNDGLLETRLDIFTPDYVRQYLWPEYEVKDHTRSLAFAKHFGWSRYQFFVPSLNDGTFVKYKRSTILPFIDEQPIRRRTDNGEEIQEHGAFGRVFSFKILPGYHSLSSSPGARFVRKELFNTPTVRFHAERKNLERVKKLEDPHLVKILKSYKHGDTFNLIFPCAKANLRSYLRDQSYAANSKRTTPIESSPLWTQALGIAKALAKVINYAPPNTSEPPQYGYHLDLKPANVLIDEDGTFIISDFGQARFQTIDETSRITPMGGTEAYAPPEIDNLDPRYNRRYDVWSLGCIFLELCTFVVNSYDGMEELDRIRLTRTTYNITEDRFFQLSKDGKGHEVKPAIVQWMKRMHEHRAAQSTHSRDFLYEIIILVERMLQVDVAKRLTIQEVCDTLTGVLRKYQQTIMMVQTEFLDQSKLDEHDIEYGSSITPHIRSMLYSHKGSWIPSQLRIIEDSQHDIIILATNSTVAVRIKIGSRWQIKVVPRYASRNRCHVGYSDCHLYFLIMEPEAAEFASTKLYFQDPADALRAYSVFTGQKIRHYSSIDDCVMTRRVPLVRRLTGLRSKTQPDPDQQREKAVSVELWSEDSQLHPSSRSGSGSSRSARQNLFAEPARRRIVVYFETSILIIRLAKNMRLERPTSTNESKVAKVIPTDSRRDSTFVASILRPSRGEVAPGIPVSKTFLDQEEESQIFEAKSVEITFDSETNRKGFYTAYRKLKSEWQIEDEEIERCRRDMGEILGYAPN